MIKPEISVPHHKDLDSSVHPIETFRPKFAAAGESIEKLIMLARTMTPSVEKGDWGSWHYHTGFGQGTLYVPFGTDGIAAVSLHCGGDIGDDDIAHSLFGSAIAVWKSPKYHYAVLAIPEGSYTGFRGDEKNTRLFFFYQDAFRVLRLEEFGSSATGRFSFGVGHIPGLELSFNYMNIPARLGIQELYDTLHYRRDSGSVSEMRLDPVRK